MNEPAGPSRAETFQRQPNQNVTSHHMPSPTSTLLGITMEKGAKQNHNDNNQGSRFRAL